MGPPLTIAAGDQVCDPTSPDLASLPEGGFVAAWSDRAILLRRFDERGAATGPLRSLRREGDPFQRNPAVAMSGDRVGVAWMEPFESRLRATVLDASELAAGSSTRSFETSSFEVFDLAVDIEFSALPEVAPGPEGSFFATWQEGKGLGFARFDGSGLDFWQLFTSSRGDCRLREPALATDPTGDGAALIWVEECTGPPALERVRARRVSGDGQPMGSLIELTGDEPFAGLTGPDLAIDAHGRLAVVWVRTTGNGAELRLERRGAEGAGLPGGGVVGLGETDALAAPSVVSDPAGNLAVAWTRVTGDPPRKRVFLRRYFADGSPAGEAGAVSPGVGIPGFFGESEGAAEPQLVLSGPGVGHAVWWEKFPDLPILVPDCARSAGLFGRRVSLGGEHALLLDQGRFRVEVEWQVGRTGTGGAAGPSGRGHAIPGSGDTGQFWFFDPANVELVTKVLDGREINGHFWFFSGALTNVGYRITVTDQERDRRRVYENPPGRLSSLADTQAFEALDELGSDP